MESNQINKSYIWTWDDQGGWNYTAFFTYFNEFNRDDDNTKYLEFGFILLFCLCSFLINFLLIYFFLSQKELRKGMHLYTLSISFSSLLFVPFALLVGITRLTDKGWMFGQFLCQTTLYLIVVTGFVKMWLMTLMSVHRYLQVVQPASRHIGPRLSRVLILIAWIVPAASLAAVIYPNSRTLELDLFDGITICTLRYKWNPTINYAPLYLGVVFVPEFLLPTIVVIVCYSLIMRKIKKSTAALMKHKSNLRHKLTPAEQLKTALRRRRTTIILITIVVLFLVMWSPLFALIAIIALDTVSKRFQLSTIWIIGGLCILLLNTIIEPLLYLLTASKVRNELRRRWRAAKCAKHSQTVTSTDLDESSTQSNNKAYRKSLTSTA